MTGHDTLILVPLTAYAGQHNGHDWEYGLYADPRTEAQALALIAEQNHEHDDED